MYWALIFSGPLPGVSTLGHSPHILGVWPTLSTSSAEPKKIRAQDAQVAFFLMYYLVEVMVEELTGVSYEMVV